MNTLQHFKYNIMAITTNTNSRDKYTMLAEQMGNFNLKFPVITSIRLQLNLLSQTGWG